MNNFAWVHFSNDPPSQREIMTFLIFKTLISIMNFLNQYWIILSMLEPWPNAWLILGTVTLALCCVLKRDTIRQGGTWEERNSQHVRRIKKGFYNKRDTIRQTRNSETCHQSPKQRQISCCARCIYSHTA